MPEIPATSSTETTDVVATVTQQYPLQIVVDGCTAPCTAMALAIVYGGGFTAVPTYQPGARVRVTVRNPQPPLVVGIETDGNPDGG